MSDPTQGSPDPKTPEPAPTPPPTASDATKTILDSVGLGTVVSGLAGLIGAVAGAGWPGIIAMVLAGGGLVFGVQYLIRTFNKSVDRRDQDNAAADAGDTAVDLTNQTTQIRHDLDDLEKNDPPPSPEKPVS